MKKSLTKAERVNGRRDVRSLFFSPRRWSVHGCSLRVRSNGFGHSRLLVSPGRKYGNAVQRNYVKRVGREFFRNIKPDILPGYDLAFIFYSGDYTFQDRKNQLTTLLKNASLLRCDKP